MGASDHGRTVHVRNAGNLVRCKQRGSDAGDLVYCAQFWLISELRKQLLGGDVFARHPRSEFSTIPERALEARQPVPRRSDECGRLALEEERQRVNELVEAEKQRAHVNMRDAIVEVEALASGAGACEAAVKALRARPLSIYAFDISPLRESAGTAPRRA